jgi:hypothetical protein
MFLSSETKAQLVDINLQNGQTINYQAEDIRKITFDIDLMNIYLWDGSIYSLNVSTINSIHNNSILSTENVLSTLNNIYFQLFPNPTTDRIYVNYISKFNENISLNIYDSNSKLLLSRSLNCENLGNCIEIIEMSGFKAGTYFCQLNDKNNKIVKQFIKR